MTTTLLQGDCRAILPTLPPASVQTVVTSPPYFGLRDYGVPGQLGLEATPDAYVQALVAVFRFVWHVLRDDGTLWLNLGDTYNAYNGGAGPGGWKGQERRDNARPKLERGYGLLTKTLKPKDMLGIPWMVAFALRADGWYLRSDIIWSKPNPMPESVTDRPTKAHEYIFLLSKSERYYYDAAAIAEPVTGNAHGGNEPNQHKRWSIGMASQKTTLGIAVGTTRNKRTVWNVSTAPYKEAHFATFPEKLIEPCILAGSAARACESCGAPWGRQTERNGSLWEERKAAGEPMRRGYSQNAPTGAKSVGSSNIHTTGFRPTCTCPNEGAARSIVLDPFAGSGTTLRVAERLCRDSIGIDLGYTDLQEKRTDGVQKMMVDLL